MSGQWTAYLLHLRLNFQLMLAPIFLWGVLAATRGGMGAPHGSAHSPTLPLSHSPTLLAFLLLHVCLYGGATAFNSVYDRDDGPIGGLKRPPPVPSGLLLFSLTLQGGGALMALAVSPAFAALYLAMLLLGIAYSHPHWRLKSRPWASILAVAFGQGVLGFFAGYVAAGGPAARAADPRVVEAACIAALATTALYPLTQVYQAEADRRRADRTFAAQYGPAACFRFAIAGTLGAGLLLAHFFARYLAGPEGLLLATGAAGAAAYLAWWSRHYDAADVDGNYDRVMAAGYTVSLALGVEILRHLLWA
jgi:1,4-dihydroxy-2-naphthoate octaprenyltransferase